MAADYVLLGLGNPGPPYRGTRHNAGAAFVEELSRRYCIPITRRKYRSLVGEGRIEGRSCLLALPQTYMNLSGQAARRMITYTGTPISRLVVIYDDLDLPLGRIRLRRDGGSGGHRGVGSIMENLGERAFIRLRIGIDRPPPDVPSEDYVLSRFRKSEAPLFREALDRAVQAVERLLTVGLDKAMSLSNA